MKPPLLCLVPFVFAGAACTDTDTDDESAELEPVELHLKVQEQRGVFELVHPGCECTASAALPLGERVNVDDIADCACTVDANHCGYTAHIETAGGDVAVTTRSWTGSFPGGTLVFDGCDERVEVPLPSEYPAPPVVSETVDEDGSIRLTWDVDASTESVTIWALHIHDFDLYRVPADAEYQDIRDRPTYGVIANRPLEERETAIGRMTVLASTGGDPYLW